MANLYITVFEDAKEVAMGDPLQEEAVSYTTASVQSTALAASADGKTRWRRMRLYSDGDCFVTWGADPTAKNDGSEGRAMLADTPEYFAIKSGHKVAVIQRS